MNEDNVNWDMIYGRYLKMSPSEFGKGSWQKIADKLGVPRSTLHRHATTRSPITGKTWVEERKELHQRVTQIVHENIVNKQVDETTRLLERDNKMLGHIGRKLELFLESDEFVVNNKNFNKLVESYEKIKMDFARLAKIIGGEDTSPKFVLNVPLRYLTPDGRSWLKRQMENPSTAIEADYEEINDEESVKMENERRMLEE